MRYISSVFQLFPFCLDGNVSPSHSYFPLCSMHLFQCPLFGHSSKGGCPLSCPLAGQEAAGGEGSLCLHKPGAPWPCPRVISSAHFPCLSWAGGWGGMGDREAGVAWQDEDSYGSLFHFKGPTYSFTALDGFSAVRVQISHFLKNHFCFLSCDTEEKICFALNGSGLHCELFEP